MIVKTKTGYQVRSESGRNLSADDLTEDEAHARLAQVEAFKARDAKKSKKSDLKTWAKSR